MVAMRDPSGAAPAVGRLTGWEPLGFEAGDNNWYRFVANGPTGATDSSGRNPYPVTRGVFTATVEPRILKFEPTYGVRADIQFKPKVNLPCGSKVKFLQIVKIRGKGPDNMNPSVRGWFVDNLDQPYRPKHENGEGNGRPSPYYNDYVARKWKGTDYVIACDTGGLRMPDEPATLYDIPGFASWEPGRNVDLAGDAMWFETVAVNASTGTILGALTWSYTLQPTPGGKGYDAIVGAIEAHDDASPNFYEAVMAWDNKYARRTLKQ